MMTTRIERREPLSVRAKFDRKLHPVIERVLRNRGVDSDHAVDYRLSRLIPPTGLSGLERAGAILAGAVQEDRQILIVGDFDADGATASALCMGGLRALGARHVRFEVPNRFDFGYGLSAPLVDHIHATGNTDLIVTVDNGISSVEGVERANALGMEVIVTDHHLPGRQLPAAAAIVNPNLPDATFASRNLAGVGVAFYVLSAVRSELTRLGAFSHRSPPPLARWLDLVALGTVADLVPLDRNNRILVSQGLARIRAGKCAPGIKALFKVAGRDFGRAAATDLGYFIAPRLNAAGRLADMAMGIRCLTESSQSAAEEMAAELDSLNRQRRDLQEDMEIDALSRIQDPDAGIVVFEESWHEGIVGLVASRLKERFHRPTFAFAPSGNEGVLKGSGRSINGFHLRDALADIVVASPGLFSRFGGHAMAAGLSLARDHLDTFRQAFVDYAENTLSDDVLRRTLWTDGELAESDFTAELALTLRNWGPWGQAFPEPLFDGVFTILDKRCVGARHTKFRVRPGRSAPPLDALCFHQTPDEVPSASELRLVYQLDVNEYMGRVTPQLIVRHIHA